MIKLTCTWGDLVCVSFPERAGKRYFVCMHSNVAMSHGASVTVTKGHGNNLVSLVRMLLSECHVTMLSCMRRTSGSPNVLSRFAAQKFAHMAVKPMLCFVAARELPMMVVHERLRTVAHLTYRSPELEELESEPCAALPSSCHRAPRL